MTPDTAHDPAHDLLERIRAAFAADNPREVQMFGVVAVMLDGAIAVAAHRDGSMLVRVDPSEASALLEHPAASRAQMGNGRTMGEGWLTVASTALDTDDGLAYWLDAATRCRLRRTSAPARRRR